MDVKRLENGYRIEAVNEYFSLYESEAWTLLVKLAEALGVSGTLLGMLYICKEEGAPYSLRAEHDQIWFGGTDAEICAEDSSEEFKALMDKLGWFIDEEAWSHFT